MTRKIILLDLKNRTIKRMKITFHSLMSFHKFCRQYRIGTFNHCDGTESILCVIK